MAIKLWAYCESCSAIAEVARAERSEEYDIDRDVAKPRNEHLDRGGPETERRVLQVASSGVGERVRCECTRGGL